MVTAIIVNYHCHLLTFRAANSVLADQPDAQVIVIDNSESEAEVQALRLALPLRVELIVSPENIGFGRACNLGYERARHDWLLLLNPDGFVLPGCIARLVQFMKEYPGAGAVAPNAWWDQTRRWLLPPAQLPTPASQLGMSLAMRFPWLGRLVSRKFRCWALGCITSEKPVRQRMLSGGNMLLRRSAVAAAGGLFDPDFFMYYEDTDLCLRLAKAGYHLYLLPQAEVVHEWQATTAKEGLMAESRQRYFQKHFRNSFMLSLESLFANRPLPVSPPDIGGHCITVSRQEPLQLFSDNDQLLELSPHPLFIPAIYRLPQKKGVAQSDRPVQKLGGGSYWLRLNGAGSIRLKILEQ